MKTRQISDLHDGDRVRLPQMDGTHEWTTVTSVQSAYDPNGPYETTVEFDNGTTWRRYAPTVTVKTR